MLLLYSCRFAVIIAVGFSVILPYVWSFLLGGLGIDRFIRGQVGIGICKLLLGWLTFGIWPLVDWIIAMVEAYGSSFGSDKEFVFIDGKYAK